MRHKSKNMILCAMFTALIICGAYIRIPFPFIPFTLQTFFVILSSLLLGAKLSAVSAFAYMLLGLVGLPVFSSGSGLSYVLHPTFGYIIGFIFGAALAGAISEKNSVKNIGANILAGISGIGIIYLCGIAYYCLISTLYLRTEISFSHIIIYCFLTTAPGDVLLTIAAAYVAQRLSSAIQLQR